MPTPATLSLYNHYHSRHYIFHATSTLQLIQPHESIDGVTRPFYLIMEIVRAAQSIANTTAMIASTATNIVPNPLFRSYQWGGSMLHCWGSVVDYADAED